MLKCIALLISTLLFTHHANAQNNKQIGVVSLIKNFASSGLSPKRSVLTVGDKIFEGQQIQTFMNSKVQIIFYDQTIVNIGPDTEISIKSYADTNTNPEFSIKIDNGILGFESGSLPSQAYQLNSPNALVKVKGTKIDLLVAKSGGTEIVLRDGLASVAPQGPTGQSSPPVPNTVTLEESNTFLQILSPQKETSVPKGLTKEQNDFYENEIPIDQSKTTDITELNPLRIRAEANLNNDQIDRSIIEAQIKSKYLIKNISDTAALTKLINQRIRQCVGTQCRILLNKKRILNRARKQLRTRSRGLLKELQKLRFSNISTNINQQLLSNLQKELADSEQRLKEFQKNLLKLQETLKQAELDVIPINNVVANLTKLRTNVGDATKTTAEAKIQQEKAETFRSNSLTTRDNDESYKEAKKDSKSANKKLKKAKKKLAKALEQNKPKDIIKELNKDVKTAKKIKKQKGQLLKNHPLNVEYVKAKKSYKEARSAFRAETKKLNKTKKNLNNWYKQEDVKDSINLLGTVLEGGKDYETALISANKLLQEQKMAAKAAKEAEQAAKNAMEAAEQEKFTLQNQYTETNAVLQTASQTSRSAKLQLASKKSKSKKKRFKARKKGNLSKTSAVKLNTKIGVKSTAFKKNVTKKAKAAASKASKQAKGAAKKAKAAAKKAAKQAKVATKKAKAAAKKAAKQAKGATKKAKAAAKKAAKQAKAATKKAAKQAKAARKAAKRARKAALRKAAREAAAN